VSTMIALMRSLRALAEKSDCGQALVAHAVILAAWEAKIRRIVVPSQPGLKVCKTLS
jgi:hypothetical protein